MTKVLSAEMSWRDTIEVISDRARTISLPLKIAGSIFAAESFGTTATRGYAKLSLTGTIAGSVVNESIEVESISVIPEQASIDVSRLVAIPVEAGVNIIEVDVKGIAEVESTAQGAGFIAGSATAGVNFSDSIVIGRFGNGDGSALPDGLRIRSLPNSVIYADSTSDSALRIPGLGVAASALMGVTLTTVAWFFAQRRKKQPLQRDTGGSS
ncbi:MAG: hypothetical protein KDK91_30160 [Gammaproteobacteria bacterium]|nr:hypothetical protein [Gammaproteobacteria bacterium]